LEFRRVLFRSRVSDGRRTVAGKAVVRRLDLRERRFLIHAGRPTGLPASFILPHAGNQQFRAAETGQSGTKFAEENPRQACTLPDSVNHWLLLLFPWMPQGLAELHAGALSGDASSVGARRPGTSKVRSRSSPQGRADGSGHREVVQL